ncbi:alpha/beta fold hydrolase [Caldovatus aquaticus]|uniref:Alpha/beta hydrolase n=1 Tax=Caldovatus aquaticus TaxID=2865671 RepID=A0ABS7F0S5_9PROT|nr:alpha/beta hydrolase [Caldovatus aquaticus]MBW8268360.1 alpha/beta hydrolase [Caldovatus aquaticus]
MATPDPLPFATATGPAPRVRGWLSRPDCRLYYEVTGRADAPALVFAHGLGGNHLSWWQQVAAFAGRYRCVTFSHRGFAPSSMPPGGPQPERFADDLAALVAALGLREYRIVAQSMGGWTALEHAPRRPPGLKALVLCATAGPFDPRLADPSGGARLAEWRARAEAARREGDRQGIVPAIGARAAAEQPALHFLYRSIGELSTGLDREAVRARLHAARTRAPADLAAVTAPTLRIAGSEDIVFPSFVVPELARAMPRARHVEIAGAGHSAYFERAAEFNRILAEFLAETD